MRMLTRVPYTLLISFSVLALMTGPASALPWSADGGGSSLREATGFTVFLPTVFQNYQPLYTDDFSNPNSGWPIKDDSVATWGYDNGEYRLLIKQAGYVVYAGNNLTATDFQAAVDARSDTPANGAYGLYFASGSAGAYVFEVAPSTQLYHFIRRDNVNNTWVTIIGATFNGAIKSGSQTNRLMVTRSGSTITLYANGTQLSQITDSTLGTGYVGAEASSFNSNHEAFFDNFVLAFNTRDKISQFSQPAIPANGKAERSGNQFGQPLFDPAPQSWSRALLQSGR